MASVKVKFRPSTVDGNEGTVYYQIIHERRIGFCSSDIHVDPDRWDERRHLTLERSLNEAIHRDLARLGKIIRELDAKGLPYLPEDIVEEFCLFKERNRLDNHISRIITRLQATGRIRTAETYQAALNSFTRFYGRNDVLLDEINSEMMEEYQAHMLGRGLTLNTVSFYMRILRAAYNRAVDSGDIAQGHPFRRVYTGVDKTAKRALPLGVLRKIKELDLSGRPSLEFARDMFLLSFSFRGMSFVDMAFLRKRDLQDGYLTYRRRKTGQRLMIRWTGDMQRILDKYPAPDTEYLLPIICSSHTNERSAYRNKGYAINHNLKRIAEMVGLKGPLTLYVARHSWASAARDKGIPLSIISAGMGHDSELTTRIYLASLETSAIDRANSTILAAL